MHIQVNDRNSYRFSNFAGRAISQRKRRPLERAYRTRNPNLPRQMPRIPWLAAIERENNAARAPPAGGAAPSFVKSVQSNVTFKDDDAEVGGAVVNPDAIAMDDMEDDSDDDE
jgi:hypothetical protein